MVPYKGDSRVKNILYTANVLDAKIAAKSSVTFPAALRMPFLQLIVAANY